MLGGREEAEGTTPAWAREQRDALAELQADR